MRFVIRADAYRMSGAGHVMRSSVIAEELIDRGYEVCFVGNLDEIPWVREYISNLGFKGIYKPDGQFSTNNITDTLILDSYEISIADPFIQPKNWNKTLVLVDDATPSYAGDIYIHAGVKTAWTKPKSHPASIFLSGLEYLLIRKSLRNLKKGSRANESQETQILISSGGSDPFSFAQNLVNIISKSTSQFHAYVLAPSFELPLEDARFEFIQLGSQYENLLGSINLVFTTAGTSSWEFLTLGIPTAVACAVKNQETNYRYLVDKSLAIDIGKIDAEGTWDLNTLILSEISYKMISKARSGESNVLRLDSLGYLRIIDILLRNFATK